MRRRRRKAAARRPGRASRVRRRGPAAQLDRGAESAAAAVQGRAVGDGGGVGQHHVEGSSGACRAKTSRCAAGEKPSVSPGCGARLSTSTRRAGVVRSARGQSGTSRCGITVENQEPGPRTTQSASRTASTASGRPAGRPGSSADARTRPAVGATATCPRTRSISSGRPGRARDVTSAWMSSGTADMGSTRPCDAEQPGDPVEAARPGRRAAPTARRSAGCRRACSCRSPSLGSGAGRRGPRSGPSRRRRRARPAPCAGRRAAARPARAEPAAGAAVVGDGDDRGEVAGDPAQRRQRGAPGRARHPSATARPERGCAPAHRADRHSRPMSRWTTDGLDAWRGQPAASFSDMATERCLPPVQPTAMVTYRLPSRR